MARKTNVPQERRKIGKEKVKFNLITITGKIVGLNIVGDGINQNSAQLQVRFQKVGKEPMPLLVSAGAASQFFQSVCSIALYAYEKEFYVTVTYAADGDYMNLVYLELPNKA